MSTLHVNEDIFFKAKNVWIKTMGLEILVTI